MQYFIQIPHIIFCCTLSAYDKWWFEQKKSPHFREKYLVLSYLNHRTSSTTFFFFNFERRRKTPVFTDILAGFTVNNRVFTDILAGFTFNNRVLRLPALIVLYLDVRVSRVETGEGRLSMEIYHKPTHSSRYLQFSSHHSDNAKSSVARALFERVSYVTGEEKRKRESGTIEEELKLNNFPHEIIIRERRKAIKKQRERAEGRTASERTTGELETRKKATISIPYIQGTSEAIRRVLGQLGIRTAMRSSKIKWSIMKGVKDKQKEEEIPGVVYAIGCGDCRKVYVGETRRTAAQRVKEHKSDTRLGHLDKSAVAEHAHTTGHHVHWKAIGLASATSQPRNRRSNRQIWF